MNLALLSSPTFLDSMNFFRLVHSLTLLSLYPNSMLFSLARSVLISDYTNELTS